MTPTEVLKMLKSKIYAARLNNCNYAIETSDIEAINQALLLYDVIRQSDPLFCPKCNSTQRIDNDNDDKYTCSRCGTRWAK